MSIAKAKAGEIWGYTAELLNRRNPTGPSIPTEINVYVRENKGGVINGITIGKESMPTRITIASDRSDWKKKTICDASASHKRSSSRSSRSSRNSQSGGTRRNYRR